MTMDQDQYTPMTQQEVIEVENAVIAAHKAMEMALRRQKVSNDNYNHWGTLIANARAFAALVKHRWGPLP